ncbi:ABC transporter ATP-binding protein [Marinicellulosiphila megalodicopiae]|uniref:ABC transporter ATP-binding protein n=1 Tax=Marinicellulosiphila megalodicopiae TaxID=2724896 RepID=UPI003BAE2051
MASLTIKNVTKTYSANPILKGIDLEINDSEFIILVGPSGCGKSTLLNSIAGLEDITSGEILIDDELMNEVAPKDRDIAMVFQSYALYPTMSVRKNIAFGLEIRKFTKQQIKQEVERVADLLQITNLLDRKPAQLSGGQRQRVAMGRALARKPKIYLFDEPLSNLDAKLRVEMRSEIKKLHQRLKTTIVYVTHDQIEAMTLADKIAIMNEGQVQQYATPQEVYDNPVNMFVAGFMGSVSMNFITCKIIDHSGELFALWEVNNKKYEINIPSENDNLKKYIDSEVIVGLRAEQITQVIPHQIDEKFCTEFSAIVDVVEPTGADTLITLQINNQDVNCRVHPEASRPVGEVIKLMVNTQKVVFFDVKTEYRI